MGKIYVNVLKGIRDRLVEENYIEDKPSRSIQLTDGHNTKDILETAIKCYKDNPNFDIKEEIKVIFKEDTDYFLFEGKKAMFGSNEKSSDWYWKLDVTNAYLNTIEYCVRNFITDLDDFKLICNQHIIYTPQYKDLLNDLEIWGIDWKPDLSKDDI